MFSISIITLDGNKTINFVNNSTDFVEVIFTIDGKEVREGKNIDEKTKGYAYPPKLEKPVKKMKDGSLLKFNPYGGEVAAYIFAGDGKYADEDIDKPAFLRHKLVDKIKFHRTSQSPIEVLRIKY